jgi:peptide methionine sulfoxide reductase MsrB
MAELTARLREQVASMRDGETTWSATHGWPSICEDLSSRGLIRITGRSMWDNRPEYRSEPTELGLAVRAAIARATGAAS